MKDKRIAWIAGAMIAVCTALLIGFILSAQHARAEKPVPIAPEQDPLPEVWVEAAETEPPEEAPAKALPIGSTHMPSKDIQPEEVIFHNWIIDEPGPADIPEEQAVENAVMVAETLFGMENPTPETVQFFKDMTGQRGNYWSVEFAEDRLWVSVDALTGNVYGCGSDRHERAQRYGQNENEKVMKDIWEDESDGEGEYHNAVRELAKTYLPGGGIKNTMLNAVHSDTIHHPAVSIFVEMQDGISYDLEWIKDGESGELMLYRMSAFADWEHLWEGWAWHADFLYYQMMEEAHWEAAEGVADGPAVEPRPTPAPTPTPVP